MPKEFTDSWLRFFREQAGLSQAELAKRVGRSKVAINHIERGHEEPSSATAQLIVAELERELGMGLRVDEVFPDPQVQTPNEAARMYLTLLRKRREGQDDDRPYPDEPIVVPEEEFEHDMAKLDAGPQVEARNAYYEKQDPATYRGMELMTPDGRLIREHPPSWFVESMRAARQGGRPRARRSSKRRSTKSSSSSDDPGEPEPASGRPSRGEA